MKRINYKPIVDVLLVEGIASSGRQSCHSTTVEPTETEFQGALREATQELQAAVSEINEILEDMQYSVEEDEFQ